MDLSKGPRQTARLIREQGGIEVAPLRLLGKSHMAGHPGRLGPLQQGQQRLGRNLRLEELVEIVSDALGKIRGERHLRIRDELDVLADRLVHEAEHPLDDLLAARALVVGAHLGGGDLDEAWHGDLPWRDCPVPGSSDSYRSPGPSASAAQPVDGWPSISRTFLTRSPGVKGLWTSATLGSSTPCRPRASSVYPDMYRTRSPGRRVAMRFAISEPLILGITTSLRRRSMDLDGSEAMARASSGC